MGVGCSECERTFHEDTIESVPSHHAFSPIAPGAAPAAVPRVQMGLIFSSPSQSLGHSPGIDPPVFGIQDIPPPTSRSWHEVTPRPTPRKEDSLSSPAQPDSARSGSRAGISRAGMTTPRDLTTPRGLAGGDFLTPRPGAKIGEAKEKAPIASVDASYIGTYQDEKKHGFGRYVANGSTYDGDFLDDLKHGTGVLSWDDGRRYCGQFAFGKFHGNAVMSWLDGRQYNGQYFEDKKHGDGVFTWQDGRKYDGQWVAGKRQGVGTYTNAKGITRTGTWQLDRPINWEPLAPPPRDTSLATCTETEAESADDPRRPNLELDDQSLHDAITARIMMGAGGA